MVNIIAQASKKAAPSKKEKKTYSAEDALVLATSFLNYIPFIQIFDFNAVPKTLSAALAKLEVSITGPIWNPILNAAVGQIIRLNEYSDTRDFFADLMPLALLRRHQVFNRIGSAPLSLHYLKQVTKVFSIDKIFQSKECMN